MERKISEKCVRCGGHQTEQTCQFVFYKVQTKHGAEEEIVTLLEQRDERR